MGEFGHEYASGPGLRIDSWGAGPFLMKVGGKVERFEDSDRFGPSRLNARGEIVDYWPEKHPFWRQHRLWVKQGRQIAQDGKTCVWTPGQPKPTLWYRDGRRKVVLEYGDVDEPFVEVPKPEPLVITLAPAPAEATGEGGGHAG